MNRGKKYRAAVEQVDREREYAPPDAVELVKKVSTSSFDGTVELHMRLGVDPRHDDQRVRGVAVLPAGTGRKVRILVFAEGDAAREAEEAGADYVGAEDLAKRIQGGWLDFDVALATPETMRTTVSKLGKVLGPRGLMPSPRSETVTTDVKSSIDEIRKGRVQFAVDRAGNIHVPIGKVSFEENQLLNNLATMIDAIARAKPSGAKGNYVRSVAIAPTMGPSVRLDVSSALNLQPSAA
ncbi:MAG TPA: 50S ribosomal protein L1 [Chloroflexota bacterium]|nr:50S ribosomal protein L1 [Chloroflexota bacterium]